MSEALVQELIKAIDDVKDKRAQTTVQIDEVDSLHQQVKSLLFNWPLALWFEAIEYCVRPSSFHSSWPGW